MLFKKKVLYILLIPVLLINLLLFQYPSLHTVYGSESVLADENFNSTPIGEALPLNWTRNRANGTLYSMTVVEKAAGDHCLKLYDEDNSYDVSTTHTFNPQAGYFNIEFDYKGDVSNQAKSFFYIEDNGICLLLGTPTFTAYNGSTSTIIGNCVNDQWYHVKITVNVPDNKFDVEITDMEGTVVASANQFSFRNPKSSIKKIAIQTPGTNSSGTPKLIASYWDNIKVYTNPPAVTGSSPANGETNVRADTQMITVYFDQNMDTGTLNPENITVTEGVYEASVAYNVYNATSISYSITLQEPLEYATTYKINLSSNVKNDKGVSMQQQSISFSTEPMPEIPLIDENFNLVSPGDSMPSGWGKIASVNKEQYYQKIVQESEGNNYLKLYSNLTPQQVGIYKTFEAQTGSVTFEMDFKTEATNTGTSQIYIYGSEGLAIKVWAGANQGVGNFSAYDGAPQVKITSPTIYADTWYRVRIIANIETNTYDMYVNDVLVAENFAFSKAVTNLNKLNIQTYANSIRTIISCWDNIKVYESKTPPRLLSIDPLNGEENVDVDKSSILLGFSHEMNPDTINLDTITITKGSLNETVPFSVYAQSDKEYVLNILEPVDYLTKYSIKLSDEIKDTVGTSLKWTELSFTTEDNPYNNPSVITVKTPSNKDGFGNSDSIDIKVDTTDTEGIRRIDFYNGPDYLGSDTVAPYEFSWGYNQVGAFSITAHVVDNEGKITISQPVLVTRNLFAVTTPVFKNNSYERITSLQPLLNLTAGTLVKNYSGEQKQAVLIICLFDRDGNMKDIAYKQDIISQNTTKLVEVGMSMPENIDGYYIKAFVWNNLDEQMQLTDVVYITN